MGRLREGPSEPITYHRCDGVQVCKYLEFRRSAPEGCFYGCSHPGADDILREMFKGEAPVEPSKAHFYLWREIPYREGRCVTPSFCPYLQEGSK